MRDGSTGSKEREAKLPGNDVHASPPHIYANEMAFRVLARLGKTGLLFELTSQMLSTLESL